MVAGREIQPAPATCYFRRDEELIVVFLVYNPAVTSDKQFDLEVEYHFFRNSGPGESGISTRTEPQRFNPASLGPQYDPSAGHRSWRARECRWRGSRTGTTGSRSRSRIWSRADRFPARSDYRFRFGRSDGRRATEEAMERLTARAFGGVRRRSGSAPAPACRARRQGTRGSRGDRHAGARHERHDLRHRHRRTRRRACAAPWFRRSARRSRAP